MWLYQRAVLRVLRMELSEVLRGLGVQRGSETVKGRARYSSSGLLDLQMIDTPHG